MKFKYLENNRDGFKPDYLTGDSHEFKRNGIETTLEKHHHMQRGGTEYSKEIEKGNQFEIEKRRVAANYGEQTNLSYTDLINKKNELNQKLKQYNSDIQKIESLKEEINEPAKKGVINEPANI